MSLHVIAGMSALDLSAGVNVASLLQGGQALGAESSVQMRRGLLPSLIGVDGQTGEALASQTIKFELNTWRNTDYITVRPTLLTDPGRSENRNPYRWVGAPIPLELEADWTITYTTTGAEDHFAMYMLSYGTPLPYKGGKIITRTGSVTAADYSTTGAFGTAGTITDLNPEKIYRVAGVGGIGGTDVGILRLKAPSFMGQVIQALVPQGKFGMTTLPHDSLVFAGVETLSIDGSGGAANDINYTLYFEEYGDYRGAQNGPTQINIAGGRSGRYGRRQRGRRGALRYAASAKALMNLMG